MSLHDLFSGVSTEAALAVLGGLLAGGFTLMRWMMLQSERRMDERFLVMDQDRKQGQQYWLEQFTLLNSTARHFETRFAQLLADLPLQYQRREDAIRQEVAIIARLDALAGKVDRALSCELKSCPNPPLREALHERD